MLVNALTGQPDRHRSAMGGPIDVRDAYFPGRMETHVRGNGLFYTPRCHRISRRQEDAGKKKQPLTNRVSE